MPVIMINPQKDQYMYVSYMNDFLMINLEDALTKFSTCIGLWSTAMSVLTGAARLVYLFMA